eukprot:1141979-Pelagomonas_calceolata.AAC.3
MIERRSCAVPDAGFWKSAGQALILSATNALDAVISSDGSVVVKSMVYMGNDTEKKRLFQLPRDSIATFLLTVPCQQRLHHSMPVIHTKCKIRGL